MTIETLRAVVSGSLAGAAGDFRAGSMSLAQRLQWDDEMRCAVATTLLALFAEPGFTKHAELFEADTGAKLSEFVAGNRPDVSGVEAMEWEW